MVGLMPTRSCAAAGFCIDPPVSSARPSTTIPEATAAAVPALLPPGTLSTFATFKVGPAQLLSACVPVALRTGTLVLPKMTAPAARMRATTGESRSGMRSTPPVLLCSNDQPAVVGKPTMSIGSFTTTGTPARGPRTSPAKRRWSMERATAIASSFIKMMAL